MGKTVAARRLLEQPGRLTLIHDVSKAKAEYDVKAFATPAEFLAQPAGEIAHLSALSFRGDPWRGVQCDVEPVAALAMQLIRARVPTRLVIDELDRAVSEGGRALESDSLRDAFVVGRSMGLDVVWSTQTPQRVPLVVGDQSSSMGLFRLGPRAINFLDERMFFDPEMLEVIQWLEVGDFVLHVPGQPWDRAIYRFE
jgi:hypothetical protein